MHYTEQLVKWKQHFVLARAYTHIHNSMATFIKTSLANGKSKGGEPRGRICPSLQLRNTHRYTAGPAAQGSPPAATCDDDSGSTRTPCREDVKSPVCTSWQRVVAAARVAH